MRQHAADESLSEETRESAQKALDALVSKQIEQGSALNDLEAEKLDLEVKKQGIEVKKQSMQVAVKDKSEAAAFEEMTEWLGQHRLQDYAADVTRIAGA